MSIKVYSNMEMASSANISLDTGGTIPPNPRLGTQHMLDGVLHYYTSIDSAPPVWVPVGMKRTNTTLLFPDPSLEWVVHHNLGTYDIIAAVYDPAGVKIDAQFVIVSANTITYTFTEPVNGKAVVFGESRKFSDQFSGDQTPAGVGFEPVITKTTGYLTWNGTEWVSVDENYSLFDHTHNFEPTITKAAGYLTWNGTEWVSVDEDYSLSTHNHDNIYQKKTDAILATKEVKVTMTTNNLDLATANLFTKTLTGATTFTISNKAVAGDVNSFILELTNGGAFTVTFWAGVKWAGGTVPTLTAAGTDVLGFYSHDGGTTWRGILMAKNSK